MIYDAVAEQTNALMLLERLIELARQKFVVLKERRHAALPAIVAAEEEVLRNLEQLRASKTSEPPLQEDRDTDAVVEQAQSAQTVAQVAAAIAELKRLNSANATLLQEHLAGVSMCLDLLQQVASPIYTPSGVGRDEKVIRPVVDVRA